MLKSNESMTISGESKIEDKVVVSMVASINTDGEGFPNTSHTVLDKELFEANIEACQADIAAFNTRVFEKQKQILGGTK